MRILNINLAIVLTITVLSAACGNSNPAGPVGSGNSAAEQRGDLAADDAAATESSGIEAASATTSATTVIDTPRATTSSHAVGSTDVPLAPKGSCGFSSDNPYPCCQNSPGQYGNCTGAAWQKAKEAGWGNGTPGSTGPGLPGALNRSWGDARNWASAASAAGYIVDSTPSVGAIGVANNGTLKNHVAFVTSHTATSVTTMEQQCGYQLKGGYLTPPPTRPISTFNAGYIRAPIPSVTMMVWSGAASATNNGTLTVSRGIGGRAVTVSFGFSLLRANVNKGPSSYRWSVSGTVLSTAGTFSRSFSTAGTFPVSVTVTNGMGISTTVKATLVVR